MFPYPIVVRIVIICLSHFVCNSCFEGDPETPTPCQEGPCHARAEAQGKGSDGVQVAQG